MMIMWMVIVFITSILIIRWDNNCATSYLVIIMMPTIFVTIVVITIIISPILRVIIIMIRRWFMWVMRIIRSAGATCPPPGFLANVPPSFTLFGCVASGPQCPAGYELFQTNFCVLVGQPITTGWHKQPFFLPMFYSIQQGWKARSRVMKFFY